MASKSLYGSFKSVGCGDLFSFSINTSWVASESLYGSFKLISKTMHGELE
jgi:hypothetical protein